MNLTVKFVPGAIRRRKKKPAPYIPTRKYFLLNETVTVGKVELIEFSRSLPEPEIEWWEEPL